MLQFRISKRSIKFFSIIFVILVSFVVFILIGQHYHSTDQSEQATNEQVEVSAVNEPIQPIPIYIKLDKNKVELGEQLFKETQISYNNSISCASCHNLNTGGVDLLVRSIGINGAVDAINAPTVFNSGFNFKLHWDGGIDTLEDQIDNAIKTPIRIGSDWVEIINKLKSKPEYVQAFAKAFSNGITSDNIKNAITTFERSLYTPNSRFDKFLGNDNKALTDEEKEGYRLFKTSGCISCHQGINVGGNIFQKFGIMADYFNDRGNITKADLGRFNVTGDELDRYVFKVPSLRNVALTPPYFHDGSAKTLQQAVAVMAKYQLGRNLSEQQIEMIVKFLNTLTGEYKGKPL